MLVSFLESIKYTNHLLPLVLLRIYVGYFYLNEAIDSINSNLLTMPKLAANISKQLKNNEQPYYWYQTFLENVVIPHWQFFSYIFVIFYLTIALSFFIGYFVRPFSLIGIILALHFISLNQGIHKELYQLLLVTNITFAWFGAGRCLGFDYFFFKRHRGLWW